MKHILNEMSEEEKNSIRSQHTGSLQVQTERFKKLVENKLGNAKPLISEDANNAPERPVKHRDSGKIVGTHKYGVGYTPNEFGKSLGHSSHPTDIPTHDSNFDDDEMGMMNFDDDEMRMMKPKRHFDFGPSNELGEDIIDDEDEDFDDEDEDFDDEDEDFDDDSRLQDNFDDIDSSYDSIENMINDSLSNLSPEEQEELLERVSDLVEGLKSNDEDEDEDDEDEEDDDDDLMDLGISESDEDIW